MASKVSSRLCRENVSWGGSRQMYLLRFLFPVADVTEKTQEDIMKFITLLPICKVATAVKAMCQYCSTVIVCNSNPHCHYISAHCYQYVR